MRFRHDPRQHSWDGTWTDITRTYITGKASERQKQMQDTAREASEAALNAIALGAVACTESGAGVLTSF